MLHWIHIGVGLAIGYALIPFVFLLGIGLIIGAIFLVCYTIDIIDRIKQNLKRKS
jgi:hypothetical protein